MFEYQATGSMFLANGGHLLADEPGLGKSKQALEAASQMGARTILVVCPAIAVGVWKTEAAKWRPDLTALTVREAIKAKRVPKVDRLLIVSYDHLVATKAVRERVGSIPHDLLILDEGHYLKNPTAKRTLLIYGPLCAGGPGSLVGRCGATRLLTGTPVLNHAGRAVPAPARAGAGADRAAQLRRVRAPLLHQGHAAGPDQDRPDHDDRDDRGQQPGGGAGAGVSGCAGSGSSAKSTTCCGTCRRCGWRPAGCRSRRSTPTSWRRPSSPRRRPSCAGRSNAATPRPAPPRGPHGAPAPPAGVGQGRRDGGVGRGRARRRRAQGRGLGLARRGAAADRGAAAGRPGS